MPVSTNDPRRRHLPELEARNATPLRHLVWTTPRNSWILDSGSWLLLVPPFTFHFSPITFHPLPLCVRFLPSLPGGRDWWPNGIPLPGPNQFHLRASERSSFTNDHRGKNRSITRFLADSFGRRSPSNPV